MSTSDRNKQIKRDIMKKEFLDVYERPEAEEVTLDIESRFLQGMSSENPNDPGTEVCAFDCESDQ